MLHDCLSQLEEPETYNYLIRDRKLFSTSISFQPKTVKYLESFNVEVEMRIPEFFKDLIQEIRVKFNDPKYHETLSADQLQQEGNRTYLRFVSHALYMVPGHRIHVTEITMVGKIKYIRIIIFLINC